MTIQTEKLHPLREFEQIAHLLPYFVAHDIASRITDWVRMGGETDDPYIHQQLKYAKRFIKNEEVLK